MIISGKKEANRRVYTATGTGLNENSASPSTNYINYINNDPVLASNLRQLQDAIFEKFPYIKADNKRNEKKYNEQLEKNQFGKKLKEQFPAFWHNGNIFFEIDVVGNKLIGLYPIDAETMFTIESDEGEIIRYEQRLHKTIEFPPEKILHIKAPSLRTGANGKPLLEPLSYTLARKTDAENYLAGMIKNLNPLLYLELITEDDQQIKAIQNELRNPRNPTDPLKIISLLKDESIGKVDTGTTENFDNINNYIDKQNDEIIRIVQIPPIVAGTVDNSNRSNSEIQERAVFGRTVNAWHTYLTTELKYEFDEKVGWNNFYFEFPVIDDRKKEAALVRAKKIREIGYSLESVHDFLTKEGFELRKSFDEDNSVEKDINDMDSRQPRDKGGIPQKEEDRKKDIENNTKKEAQ